MKGNGVGMWIARVVEVAVTEVMEVAEVAEVAEVTEVVEVMEVAEEEAQKAVVATKLLDYQQAMTYSTERTEITNSITQELKRKFEDLAEVEDSVLAAKVREWLRNHSKASGGQSSKQEVQMGKKLAMWRLWAKEHPDEVKVRQVKLMAESNEETKDQVVFWGRAGTELWSELTREQQEECHKKYQ
ncbi:hypothetical protein WOLCODRAFT_158657 [Wolfiporia cocos MD-104 SS10]|uniref:Uncharacterized protein n=1 Tax=Wolfiporia cocos (strain MD-104) TaxID=742152 RepID=A0A2H3JSV3_WOLCO|nr:hypothetical protein WOLCODRAFT_158657 [Wolfiporia cocos MD-104 SS10]